MDNTSAGEILDDVHTGCHPAGHTVAGEWAHFSSHTFGGASPK